VDPTSAFALHPERPRLLLIGAEGGIGAAIAQAERLTSCTGWKPLLLLGSDRPFPFRARPSSVIVAGIPPDVIACMPLVEEWGIPCRLASHSDFPGCFAGPVTALADGWLSSLGPEELKEVEIFACGPAAMLNDTRALAARYGVPYQILELAFSRS
jgi:dihydroorotate dehydrogenase electron transfer subunit